MVKKGFCFFANYYVKYFSLYKKQTSHKRVYFAQVNQMSVPNVLEVLLMRLNSLAFNKENFLFSRTFDSLLLLSCMYQDIYF